MNAVKEVKQNSTLSLLEDKHIDKIYNAYKGFKSIENFSEVITIEDVLNNKGNMSISLYVRPDNAESIFSLPFEEVFQNWEESGKELKDSMNELFKTIEG